MRQRHRGTTTVTPGLVIGLLVMGAGAILLLDQFGIADATHLLRYWPAGVIVVGLLKLMQSGQTTGGLWWILVGCALLGMQLGVLSFATIWALGILAVGAHIAWRALSCANRSRRPLSAEIQVDDSASFQVFAALGGVSRSSRAPDFRGANLTAVMGGCEVDLTQATIVPGDQAAINAFTVWGGVEIKVPRDWEVVNQGTAVMGGFVDSTTRDVEPRGRLIVTGLAIMGGVEIKN